MLGGITLLRSKWPFLGAISFLNGAGNQAASLLEFWEKVNKPSNIFTVYDRFDAPAQIDAYAQINARLHGRVTF